MAFLNWIFWKKATFTTGIAGLSAVPLVLVHGYSSGVGSMDASDYKKNMEYLSGKYAHEFGIAQLTNELLNIPEMKGSAEDVLAEDLALLAVGKSDLFKKSYEESVREEESAFDGERGNIDGKFFDSKGGDRASMRRRNLTQKAYEDFKKEILDFDHKNFVLNKYGDSSNRVNYGVHLSKELIEKTENWKHIGFYARGEARDKQDPTFARHKFDFINFAHRIWFEEVRPFYAWMSLWKHKDKASAQELESFWDISSIKSKNVQVTEANYQFPYFETKNVGGIDTTTKFKNFFKNVVTAHASGKSIYIPKGYTEDSATSILVEGKNMYSNLYVRFAAAANHKYQQKLKNLSSDSSSSSAQPINQREKTEAVSGYTQPTELFMFGSTDNNGVKARVKVSADIFKQSSHKTKNEIADLVEIKDTPWVFIRNRAGIHAIAVDVENMASNQKDVYGFFQYRTLQALYKEVLGLKQTLDIKVDQVINSFKEYLTQNLNRIILKYLYARNDLTFFGHKPDREIADFKDTFLKREELEDVRNRYFSRVKLREALINTYAQNKWEVNDSDNKFKNAAVAQGMAAMIPWKMKTDDFSEDKDQHTFEELEKIYDFSFFKDGNAQVSAVSITKSLAKEYEEKLTKYEETSKKFVDGLNLTLNPESSGMFSDRVFSNNYYVNRITDKFLDKSEVFNEFLFKYIIRSGYLTHSILGAVKSKEMVQKDFKLSLPADFVESGSSGTDVLEKIDSLTDNGATQNIKKVFGKLNDQITTNYYSRYLLEKESTNPWDVAKFGGDVLKKEKDKQKDRLHKIAKRSFEDRLIFSDNDFKQKHYKFLTALSYLLADNFSNLLKYLRSSISYKTDSYITFFKPKDPDMSVKMGDESLMNPFLNRESNDDDTFTKQVDDIKRYFSTVNFSDSGNKVSSGLIYLGFYNESSSSTLPIPDKYKSQFDSDKLYRYGSSKDEMSKYVETISSNEEFKRVVDKIKKVTQSSTDKAWVDHLSKDQIYVTTSSTNGSTTKTIKILTLQEKKNLLIAYLKDVDVNITNDSIEKSKFKDVFLTDPDKSYNSTNSTHTKGSTTKGSTTKVQESYFTKSESIKDSASQDVFKLFQLNAENVKDFDAFKTYANSNLSSDVFWAWVIDLAQLPAVQDLAMNDLGSSSTKIEVFDAEWARVGKDKFVKK